VSNGHRPCLTCSNPEVDRVNAAIVAGERLASIAKWSGIGPKPLGRHKRAHLSPALVPVAQVVAIRDLQRSALERVNDLAAELEGRIRREGITDHAYLQTADRLLKSVELLARLSGELRPSGVQVQVLNVSTSQDWLDLRARVLDAVAPWPDARLAIARALAPDAPRRALGPGGARITPYKAEEAQMGSWSPLGEDGEDL